MHRSITEQRSPTRGLASVELALLLPLLMLVLYGTSEYGWMSLKNQELADAARSGARVAVTVGATNALAQPRVDEVMTNTGLAASGYQVTFVPGDVAARHPGDSRARGGARPVHQHRPDRDPADPGADRARRPDEHDQGEHAVIPASVPQRSLQRSNS